MIDLPDPRTEKIWPSERMDPLAALTAVCVLTAFVFGLVIGRMSDDKVEERFIGAATECPVKK